MPALDANRHAVVGRRLELHSLEAFPALVHDHAAIDEGEHDEQQDGVEQQDRPDVLQRPEERNATQVAEEQRRVAQRRQAAAHVGDHKDEEHDDVHLALAPQVGTKQRADEQHGGARRADPAGKERADEQQDDVVLRRADDGTAHENAAGDDEQAQQQHDERDVVADDGLGELLRARLGTEADSERHQEHERPKRGGEELVFLPPLPFYQRHDRDRQEHAHKGDDAPDRQHLSKFHMLPIRM